MLAALCLASLADADLPCGAVASGSCTADGSVRCFYDESCAKPASATAGGVGCNANGYGLCRFCGKMSNPAFVDCPLQAPPVCFYEDHESGVAPLHTYTAKFWVRSYWQAWLALIVWLAARPPAVLRHPAGANGGAEMV